MRSGHFFRLFFRLAGLGLAFGLALAMIQPPMPIFAQPAAPAAGDAAPAPAVPSDEAPAPPADSGAKPLPGVPDESSVTTLELTPRPVALIGAKAEWETGYKSVQDALAKVDAAIKKAGLTVAGHPFAVFLQTDDKSFQFEAMVPLAEKPEAKELSDGVKTGESPGGKAIKFLHRGAYDDIDSTYELITAFLDEKGLESQNRFIEEYLTPTAEPDDANFEADIYVFIK